MKQKFFKSFNPIDLDQNGNYVGPIIKSVDS
jgi:hypothetical protein